MIYGESEIALDDKAPGYRLSVPDYELGEEKKREDTNGEQEKEARVSISAPSLYLDIRTATVLIGTSEGSPDEKEYILKIDAKILYLKARELTTGIEIAEPFKLCTVTIPAEMESLTVSFLSHNKDIYLFQDRLDGFCPYWPIHDPAAKQKRIPPGFYWTLTKREFRIQGPHMDTEDARSPWSGYILQRYEVERGEDLVLRNKAGEILFKIRSYQGAILEGNFIDDGDSERPIIRSQPGLSAPSDFNGKAVVWYRPLTTKEKYRSEWEVSTSPQFDLEKHFPLTEGPGQIDISYPDGSSDRLLLRWFPFLESLDYERGIISPVNGEQLPRKVLIQVDDDEIFVSSKDGVCNKRGKKEWILTIPENEEQAVLNFYREPQHLGQAICRLKRFRWGLREEEVRESVLGVQLRELCRRDFSYGKNIDLIFPAWITGLWGNHWISIEGLDSTLMKRKVVFKHDEPFLSLGDYYDTLIATRFSLYIRYSLEVRQKEVFAQKLFYISAEQVECPHCGEKITFDEETKHLLEKHPETCFQQLSYEEIRENYMPHLPEKVYICSICGYHTRADVPYINPTTDLDHHQKKEHPGQKNKFRVCNDADEIREKYIKNLPRYYRCKICGKEIMGEENHIRRLLYEHARTHSGL